MILALYVLGLVALVIHAPPLASAPQAGPFVAVLAALGAWHVGWATLHFGRATLFQRHYFPALRRAAAELEPEAARHPHLYLLIATFGVRAETTVRVVQAAIDEAVRFGGPATLVASLAEGADQRLIKRIFQGLAPPDRIRLVFVRRPCIGHACGVASGLRAITRARPPESAVVAVVTGDTLLPSGTLEGSLPLLEAMPDVDLVLTDEVGLGGQRWAGAWLAFIRAQRRQMMSSLALGHALDFPAGGVLLLRAELLTRPSIAGLIKREGPDCDGPLGIGELIWLELLRTHRRMLYLPDVSVVRVDGPSGSSASGATLIRRTCRVRLELAKRIVSLAGGPAAILLRARLLEWVVSAALSLAGLVAAISFTAAAGPWLLWAYVVWLGVVRLLQTLLLWSTRARVSGLWPLLDEFDRIMTGAMLGWTLVAQLAKQPTEGPPGSSSRSPRRAPAVSRAPTALQALPVAVLVIPALLSHLLGLPVPEWPGTGP